MLLIPISLATLVMFGLKKEAGLLLFTRISQDTTLTHKSAQPDSIYRSILLSADKYFRNKNYEKCLIELDRAQKMRPNDADLKARIIKTKGLLSDQKLQSEEFTKAVASGDSYFNSKDYLNAKAAYQQAVGKNPDDLNVQAKLRKTMELLRSAKAQNILYDVAVASADKLFTDQEYEKALKEYENALTILPGEQYPKTKINEIIKIRVDQQVKDEEYGKAIFNADKFYNSKVFLSALQEYKRANSLKPSEKYPQDRIAELTTLINAQKTKDESYSKAIATADKYFLDTQYPEAIKTYQEALTIKPDQIYPKNRIKEIENILAEVQKSQEAYNQYVSLADSFYIDKQYMKARENYMMAHSVKPKENYPKEMMAKVENMMIGQEANMAKALDEQYISILHKADELLKSKSYEPARSEYLKASNIKPDEIYPKEKLSEIGKILEELAKSKELEMENIKALETKYLALINEADKDFKAKLYEQARSVYSNALNFKPESQYPKEKIDAIDKLLADAKRQEADYISAVDSGDHLMVSKSYSLAKIQYGNALKIKPGEAYPRNKIQEADIALGDEQKQKTLDTQYAGLIVNGDKLFMEKSFAMAKTEFVKALNLKPTQSYPKEKIAEIEKIQGELDNLQAINKQYQTILLKADQLLASKSYDLAKTEYANAGNLKPEEQYPKTKMAEIEKILADITAQKSLDDQYKLRIEQADQFFVTKTFDQAKNSYQAALTLKPEEKYPKTKIAQIDTVYAQMARQKAFDDNYAQMLANADKLFLEKSYEMAKQEYKKALALKPADPIPTARLSEIDKALGLLAQVKAKEEQYSKAIAAADKLFNEKSYEMAKTGYEAASGIKPEEQYPKDKVSEINTLLTEIARQKSIQEKYLASITKADQLLASKLYDLAKTEYANAGNLKPEEQYPKTKMAEIEKILADITAQKSLDDQYKLRIEQADQFFVTKTFDQAKNSYQAALTLKPEEK
ncbi:MAG: hypothetical protein PHF97_03550, partial [Bacteroidales bacterium]|nr:hypothetical protein [Bacteroidales bacterium]